MKTIYPVVRKLVASVVVLAMTGLVAETMAENGAPEAAMVVGLSGKARYSGDAKSWQTLKKGDVLNPGSLIQTAEGAKVDILLGEWGARLTSLEGTTSGAAPEPPTANVVRILEGSVLGIDKLTADQAGTGSAQEIQLDLRLGQVMGSVKNLAGGSKFEIKVPNGVVGLRGTSRYTINSAGMTSVRMGSMVVAEVAANGSMVTEVVRAGQQFDSGTGLISEIPVNAPVDPQPVQINPAPKAKLPPPVMGIPTGPLRKF